MYQTQVKQNKKTKSWEKIVKEAGQVMALKAKAQGAEKQIVPIIWREEV